MEELKACPFCGGKAEVIRQWKSEEGTGKNIWIRCKNCGVETVRYDTDKEAAAKWNRRAAPENKPLTLEQLRQMKGQPVYCIGQTRFDVHFDGWKVVAKNNLTADVIRFTDNTDFPAKVYGERLLAYACKPCAEIGHESAENGSATVSGGAQDKLCREDENFIQTKFGYCFYTFDVPPIIYNLYVHPQYRRCGHSRELLKLVIAEIRKSGYEGEIRIDAEPKENSIGLADLMKYYKSMGLTIRIARKPEGSEP
jgi:Lar family restriction alleviation protein